MVAIALRRGPRRAAATWSGASLAATGVGTLLWALLSASCRPAWTSADYRPRAQDDAQQTAAREHGCAVDRVKLRCDATVVLKPLDGQVVVGDEGAGVHVDSIPEWEFEFDVCGAVRRYAFDSRNQRFFEKKVTCEKGICLDALPGCKNTTRGAWLAVEGSRLDRCSDAPVDDSLSPTLDGNRVEVTLSNRGPRARSWWIGGRCEDPSLVASIDGRLFSLCGFDVPLRRASVEAGSSIKVPSGPFLAAGPHEIEIYHIEPLESVWPPCTRSGVRKIDVPASAPER